MKRIKIKEAGEGEDGAEAVFEPKPAAAAATTEVKSDVALGYSCDHCKEPITSKQTLIRCRVLNCPSSYKLHLGCVALAEAAGSIMVCSKCTAKVRIAPDRKKIPQWAQMLMAFFIISVLPALLADFIIPLQMARLGATDHFLKTLIIRTLFGWLVCILGVIGLFLMAVSLKFIYVTFWRTIRIFTN